MKSSVLYVETPPASIRTALRAVRMSAIALQAWARRAKASRATADFCQAKAAKARAKFYLGQRQQKRRQIFPGTHPMPKYVYILTSLSRPNMIYTGKTSDPHRRLTEHNAGKSFHTSKHCPWKLVFYIWFEDDHKADTFEQLPKKVGLPAGAFYPSSSNLKIRPFLAVARYFYLYIVA